MKQHLLVCTNNSTCCTDSNFFLFCFIAIADNFPKGYINRRWKYWFLTLPKITLGGLSKVSI